MSSFELRQKSIKRVYFQSCKYVTTHIQIKFTFMKPSDLVLEISRWSILGGRILDGFFELHQAWFQPRPWRKSSFVLENCPSKNDPNQIEGWSIFFTGCTFMELPIKWLHCLAKVSQWSWIYFSALNWISCRFHGGKFLSKLHCANMDFRGSFSF